MKSCGSPSPGRPHTSQDSANGCGATRRRLSLDALLVEACNRLATQSAGRAVLAFEAIDAADEATVETMAQILQRPGWLRLPLLFTMRGIPQGRVAELMYLLHRDEGEAAVMAIEDEATPEQEAASVDWTMLPADVLRVLRASAVLGTSFEAELVAQLLEEPLSLSWRSCKRRPMPESHADRGDRPVDVVRVHRRGPPTEHHAVPPEVLACASGEILSGSSQTARADRVVRRGRWHEVRAQQRPRQLRPRRAPSRGGPGQAVRATTFRAAAPDSPSSPLPGDHTRAATHWQAAGQTAAAVAHYLAAVREAAARGDARRAYGLAEQALTLLDQLPAAPTWAVARPALARKGRLQWHGPAGFSLYTARGPGIA